MRLSFFQNGCVRPFMARRRVGASTELPDSQAHQCHAQRNPSEESHRNDGLEAYGGIWFFFHAVILILDHA